MEKPHHQQQQPTKSKKTILKFMSKLASSMYFQNRNHTFSPRRDHRTQRFHIVKRNHGNGYYGPIVPIIADQTPTKNGSFRSQEPKSPKISCMGQVGHKKKIIEAGTSNEIKKHGFNVKRLLSSVAKAPQHGQRRSDVCVYNMTKCKDARAPALSQMTRFASGRDHAFANFDWLSQVDHPVESDHRDYYDGDGDGDGDGDKFIVPFSAPVIVSPEVGDLLPRKEVNLWQRRTINPPKRLQLNE